jgi:autotransporter-associated beta strand protein
LVFSNTGAIVSADAASLNVTQSANPNQLSVVPAIGATDALAVGMVVSGPGIPSGAVITAISPYTITLDQAAAVSGTANISFSAVNRSLTLNGSSGGTNSLAGTLADSVGGGKLSVIKNGTGVWQLTGTNTYSGGTFVTDGTMIATNPAAIPDNSNLYVGAANSIFAPVASSAPVAAAPAGGAAAVPEPGTLALVAGAVTLLVFYRRRRR